MFSKVLKLFSKKKQQAQLGQHQSLQDTSAVWVVDSESWKNQERQTIRGIVKEELLIATKDKK